MRPDADRKKLVAVGEAPLTPPRAVFSFGGQYTFDESRMSAHSQQVCATTPPLPPLAPSIPLLPRVPPKSDPRAERAEGVEIAASA